MPYPCPITPWPKCRLLWLICFCVVGCNCDSDSLSKAAFGSCGCEPDVGKAWGQGLAMRERLNMMNATTHISNGCLKSPHLGTAPVCYSRGSSAAVAAMNSSRATTLSSSRATAPGRAGPQAEAQLPPTTKCLGCLQQGWTWGYFSCRYPFATHPSLGDPHRTGQQVW